MDKVKIINTLKQIPVFELSYEEPVDKKVYSDICFAIPYGVKYVFWFTFVNNEFLCISIPMQGNKLLINNYKIEVCCFNNQLCYGNGTICMGIKINNSQIVVLYDIFYYKNICFSSQSHYRKKIETLGSLLYNIKNDIILSHQLSFFLPQFASNFIELCKKTRDNNIYCYMFIDLYSNSFKKYIINASSHLEKIFIIRPSEHNVFDMYDLYIYNNGRIEYYNKAHINTLKMSYTLNKYFYNYKYIDEIDHMEESDDETDITNECKKEAYVRCYYNRYLKLWEPVELVHQTKIKLSTLKEIEQLTSSYNTRN